MPRGSVDLSNCQPQTISKRYIVERDGDEPIHRADFGLGRHAETGLRLLIYVNDERYCAKEMVLFPGQTCPEHLHPPFEGTPGKQETLRVRFGTVYLYVPGEAAPNPVARPYRPEHCSVWHEIILRPGEQHTIPPMTKHWFFSPETAVISEFSTHSKDEFDVFSDPQVVRVPRAGAGYPEVPPE